MTEPVLLLILLDFASVGLLGAAFFRRGGRPGLKWWATVLPIMLCPVLLVAAYAAGLTPLTPARWAGPAQQAAVVLSAASIALMFYTWGTHRVRLYLWHQTGDAPQEIVTYGAYRWIRHPFYTAYLLLFLAAAAFFPSWATFGLVAYMLVALTLTAAGEEQRLSASAFGAEYRRYLASTGRFVPRLAAWPGIRRATHEEPT
ncbi:MAG TPA: methyltransferase [Streptosporangiaceae bacterium]|jgi:protein-S-isoprenylcysteine O-methyltransferase Ste14|nr:methyltransferase [Streptosporangiaceae bacterium]